MTLLELSESDPILYATDKNEPHSYITNIYSPLFSDLPKDRKILEVGVYTGNSVKLWSDFFNQGFIFGIDNMDKYLKIPLSGENYEILIKEAYNIESVDFFKKRGITFDIIIEDGLHSFETQMYALEHYNELLNRGGMMIIEDIQHIEAAEHMLKTFSNCTLMDLRNQNGRYDDIVIIRRK